MDKGESYFDAGLGVVKESVKVSGLLSHFRGYFDMQNAVVDGEAHEKHPYEN